MSEKKEAKRESWGNHVEFILTSIGYAVGLGNVWRFPKQAFENGGGSFLVVYLIVSFLFGLPTLYLEMSIGQFSRTGPANAFGWMAFGFRGIGYAMIMMSAYVAIYYNVIVAWAVTYVMEIMLPGFTLSKIVDCNKKSYHNSEFCCQTGDLDPGACSNIRYKFAAEEFYNNYILDRTLRPGDFDRGGMSWEVFAALVLCWLVVFLVLAKGTKILGKVNYVVCTLPFIIIAILFGRGVSLIGAERGIYFYLVPQWSKILDFQTWKSALVQNCYSLSVAMGGLLTLASYNKRTNNVFRDALIVSFADAFMSIFGGIASFAILGHMSFKMDRDVEDVIDSGTGMAFITYPTAIGQMPADFLWALLFFLMLIMLGFGSMFGLTEAVINGVTDTWPKTRPFRTYVTAIICFVMFCIGIIMTSTSGIFYFSLFDEYATSISLVGTTMLELIAAVYIYGAGEFLRDLRTILGNPRWKITRAIGPTGYYIAIAWLFITPSLCIVIVSYEFFKFFQFPWQTKCLDDHRRVKACNFTPVMYLLGTFLSWSPLLTIVGFAIFTAIELRQKNQSLLFMFRPSEKWPSRKVREVRDLSYIHRTFAVPAVDEVPDPKSDRLLAEENAEVVQDPNNVNQQ